MERVVILLTTINCNSVRFYEWHTAPDREKQPYYIQLKDSVKPHMTVNDNDDDDDTTTSKQMLTMAGLFDKQISVEVRLFFYYILLFFYTY